MRRGRLATMTTQRLLPSFIPWEEEEEEDEAGGSPWQQHSRQILQKLREVFRGMDLSDEGKMRRNHIRLKQVH